MGLGSHPLVGGINSPGGLIHACQWEYTPGRKDGVTTTYGLVRATTQVTAQEHDVCPI
jgi:hypothetical protein